MTYEDAKRLRRSMKNPWLTLAIERITERGYMWKHEFTLTVMEYNGADEHYGNPACPECGRRMWYRSTVGTVVCPSCHHVGRS